MKRRGAIVVLILMALYVASFAAADAARALNLVVEIRENPEIRGGLRLTTADHRIVVENTVGSRLNRTRSTLVSRIAAILWADQPGVR